jgi:translation initiation factor IF-2
MRVYQLAEELGVTSKELITKAKELQINIKSSVINISKRIEDQLRKEYQPKKVEEPIAAEKKTVISETNQPVKSVVHKPIVARTEKSITKVVENKESKQAEVSPIIPNLTKETILEEKGIRALRTTELNYYSKEVSDNTKELKGKIVDRPGAVRSKPFIKKTFFFKKKSMGQPHSPVATKPVERKITISNRITLKDLCEKIGIKANLIIKKLIEHDIMMQINDYLSEDALILIGLEFDYNIIVEKPTDITSQLIHTTSDKPEDLKLRPPVVTFMGHVDHGKTSLMDKIRSSNVASTEAGYITQHLGAYEVEINNKRIVLLDTPGHEAFTQMRSRGANVTDIVIIVVAADDGVMPQTEEAISHARAANLPIIVAINKIDKSDANLHKVKQQLSSLELVTEEWGGKTIFSEVSALTGQGVSHLLEMILLQAEMMELKANPNRRAYGTALEAKLTETQGPLVTFLVQNGTLKIGDIITCGSTYGKIRAMFDSYSNNITQAGPVTLVRVSGIAELPMSGDKFYVVESVQTASELAEAYKERKKNTVDSSPHTTLDNLYDKIAQSHMKEIKIILKADVQGSLEVISQLLNNFSYKEVQAKIIHKGVGQINESDVLLADVSDAIIIGFNNSIEERAKNLASEHGIEIKIYNIIYEIIENMKLALEGLLEPEKKEVTVGKLAVRSIFKISRFGNIAGCFVTEGKIERSCQVRVCRNNNVIYTGKLSSLKRFKDDVREVNTGFECGVKIEGFDSINIGDIIEAFQIEKQLKKLVPNS